MDDQTIAAYRRNAKHIAENYKTLKPKRLYELADKYFAPGGTTIDIGCGTGRDLTWLRENGFPAIGVEPVPEMREIAQKNNPAVEILDDSLPELKHVNKEFQNVYCSAVLMHVPSEQLQTALKNLLRITAPGGHLILSYRGSRKDGNREEDGRLFEPITNEAINSITTLLGADALHSESIKGGQNSAKLWQTVIIGK